MTVGDEEGSNGSLVALRALATAKGLDGLVDSFPESWVTAMLAGKSVPAVLGSLQGVETGLDRLRELEQQADVQRLEQFFLDGNIFSRGVTCGGVPVVHHARVTEEYWVERVVQNFWVVLWCMRQRRDPDRGIAYVGDFSESGMWNFNPNYIREASRLFNLLFPYPLAGIKVRLLVKNDRLQYFLHWFTRPLPAGFRDSVEVPGRRQEIVGFMANPCDLPDSVVHGYGMPFEANPETLGDFRSVLQRRGFAGLTAKHVYRPDLVELSPHPAVVPRLRGTPIPASPALEGEASVAWLGFGIAWGSNRQRRGQSLTAVPEGDLPEDAC